MQNNNHEFIFNRYEEKERLQLGRQHNHAINTFFSTYLKMATLSFDFLLYSKKFKTIIMSLSLIYMKKNKDYY